MIHSPQRALVAAMLLLAAGPALAASFVYEGRLDDYGQPANGTFDLRIAAFSERHLGAAILPPTSFFNVAVVDGQFRLEVELPLATTDDVWVEAAVREQGGIDFSAIPGRSKAVSGTIGQCWSTTGDAGSSPATNFIGTTDAQPLVLRTRNVQSLRIEPSSILFGGAPNTTNTIAGSLANNVTASVRGAVIAGGGLPSGNSDPGFGLTGPNRVTDAYGSVGGGYNNQAGDNAGTATDRANATVGGGVANIASGRFSSIGGGDSNLASGESTTIAGGHLGTASGTSAVIGGGQNNTALGGSSTVAGGAFNRASGSSASIAGGSFNAATGSNSTVGGGEGNCAGGSGSWAGGTRATARRGTGSGECVAGSAPTSGDVDGDEGTFIWADSREGEFHSNGPDRFLVRATDGATFQRRLGSDNAARAPRGYFNVVRGDSGVNLPASPSANVLGSFESDGDAFLVLTTPADSSRGLVFRSPVSNNEAGLVYTNSASGLQFLAGNATRMTLAGTGQLTLNTLGSAGSTALCRNASNQIASCSSSARYKEDIEDLQLGLDALAQLRPVSYRWKDDGMADVGFVAEEVARLDERLITRNDRGQIEGVKYDRLSAVLAGAVQELALRLEAERKLLDGQLQQLASDNAALREAAARSEARLARLEAILASAGR